MNQWKNTSAVLKWYNRIPTKTQCSFIQFDIKSFYPSITGGLMNKAIEFAKTIVDIPDEDLSVIMQSRKNLLSSEKVPRVKKERDEDFDVPMGCYNGAEVCEIVGSYILNLLGNILDKDLVGLYRDDGLAIVRNLSGPEIERKRKAIIKLFKECGLNITIQTNLKIVNFLDIEMNLGTGTYRPYRKPDNMPVYIIRKLNHPPTIIKEILKAIVKWISDISSSELFLMSRCQYIQMHSQKVVSMTTLHLSQKPLTPRQTRKRHVNVKSYGLILHIALVSKQMLEGYF